MRYLMMSKPSDTAPDEKLYVEMGKFIEELTATGALLATGGLEPSGVVMTSRGDEITVTDGPFAEAKEFLAGFWIVDVDSTDRAHEIAAAASAAPGKDGTPLNMPIEVRQVMSAPPSDV